MKEKVKEWKGVKLQQQVSDDELLDFVQNIFMAWRTWDGIRLWLGFLVLSNLLRTYGRVSLGTSCCSPGNWCHFHKQVLTESANKLLSCPAQEILWKRNKEGRRSKRTLLPRRQWTLESKKTHCKATFRLSLTNPVCQEWFLFARCHFDRHKCCIDRVIPMDTQSFSLVLLSCGGGRPHPNIWESISFLRCCQFCLLFYGFHKGTHASVNSF